MSVCTWEWGRGGSEKDIHMQISGAGPESSLPLPSLLCASLFTSLRLSSLSCTWGVHEAGTEGSYED